MPINGRIAAGGDDDQQKPRRRNGPGKRKPAAVWIVNSEPIRPDPYVYLRWRGQVFRVDKTDYSIAVKNPAKLIGRAGELLATFKEYLETERGNAHKEGIQDRTIKSLFQRALRETFYRPRKKKKTQKEAPGKRGPKPQPHITKGYQAYYKDLAHLPPKERGERVCELCLPGYKRGKKGWNEKKRNLLRAIQKRHKSL